MTTLYCDFASLNIPVYVIGILTKPTFDDIKNKYTIVVETEYTPFGGLTETDLTVLYFDTLEEANKIKVGHIINYHSNIIPIKL